MSYLVEVLLAAAEDARDRGDERGARLRFSEVLKADPTNLSARHGLALLDDPQLETTVVSDEAELEPTVASTGMADELEETRAMPGADELEETRAMADADDPEETVAAGAASLEPTVASARARRFDETDAPTLDTVPSLELDLPAKKKGPTRAKSLGAMQLAKKSVRELNAVSAQRPRGAEAIFGPARLPRYLGVDPAVPRVRSGFVLAALLAVAALAVIWPPTL